MAERQLVATQRQVAIDQRRLINEGYACGAEMLGSNVLSVRLGEIYALWCLAEGNPQKYHVQVMELFCAFARLPSPADGLKYFPLIHER